MRSFIAIEVPKDIKEYISQIQKLFSQEDIKITFAKSFHLTLKFLGEVQDNNIEEIKNKLDNIGSESFSIKLSSLGVFPDQNRIKVVWIGLDNKEKIIALQKKIESVLPEFKPDKRFHPHITLGRVKSVKNKQKIIELLKTKLEQKKIKVNSFFLIKSTLTPNSPKYEKLKGFALN